MQPNANILSKAKVQRSPGWPGLGFAINQFAWENARLGKIARRPLLQIRDICPTLLSIENHVLVGKWQGGSKPLRLRQQVANRAAWRFGKNVFGYQRRLFALAQERVLHAGVAGGGVANTG